MMRIKKWVWPVVWSVFGLWMSSCHLTHSEKQENFISLKTEDSLTLMDSAFIVLTLPGTGEFQDTVLMGRVNDTAQLRRLRSKIYVGGDVDISITGFIQGRVAYRRLIHFNAELRISEVDYLPIDKDSLPPVIHTLGNDTIDIALGVDFVEPGVSCMDDWDGRLEVKTGSPVDKNREDHQFLIYTCVDSSGNEASKDRVVRVGRGRDWLAPILLLNDSDTLHAYSDSAQGDPGAECTDERDGVLQVNITGTVNWTVNGSYKVGYACRDHFGNSDTATRIVLISDRTDTLAPVITLRGRDTVETVGGKAYVDSGAACFDARDGVSPVTVADGTNTGVKGVYSVHFDCKDKSGNPAVRKTRTVRVVEPPDTTAPVLALLGKDTVKTFVDADYDDSGAVCLDARDSVSVVIRTGSVNTAVKGFYPLHFDCKDSANNAATRKTRWVEVIDGPDLTVPMLILNGKDTIRTFQDSVYVDTGATCVDDRDGVRPVERTGSVNVAAKGFYTLQYQCKDLSDNFSQRKTRVVEVIDGPDRIAPLLALTGASTVNVNWNKRYSEPGADCQDDRDGTRAVTISRSVDTTKAGDYQLDYSCSDLSGNSSSNKRLVKVERLTELPIRKEAEIDTGSGTGLNMGHNATGAFFASTGDNHVILMQFDLSQVDRTSVTSAKALFHTFGNGNWNGDSVTVTLRLYRVQSSWTEGTGNFYWHDGGWKNGGSTYFPAYPMSTEIMAASTNPGTASGVTGASVSMVRRANLIDLGTRQVDVKYTAAQNFSGGAIPAKENLVPVQVDLTDYIQGVPASSDFGFVIVAEDYPAGKVISWMTKEAGDNTVGPKLLLEY